MFWLVFSIIERFLKFLKDTFNDYGFKTNFVDSDIIDFNVGGTLFSIYKSNITKNIIKLNSDGKETYEPNLLHKILIGQVNNVKLDKNNAIFIDRNPKCFNYILDYLRKVNTMYADQFKIPKNAELKNEILEEAIYFELFGLIDMIKLFSGSKILSSKNTNDLIKLCDFSLANDWKLIYRGTSNGFGANHFHAKCDGIEKTLTLVKTTQSYIFGGYTNAAWDSSNQYKQDQEAYIISLVNKDNKPVKLNFDSYNGNNAIFCGSIYGPVFGAGKDFQISDNANENTKSLSNLGYSYGHKNPLLPYKYKTNEAQSFLAGSYNFQISEIEVYQKY